MDKEKQMQKKQSIVIKVFKELNGKTIMKKKTENYYVEKERQDSKSKNCTKCGKYFEIGAQCGYWQR